MRCRICRHLGMCWLSWRSHSSHWGHANQEVTKAPMPNPPDWPTWTACLRLTDPPNTLEYLIIFTTASRYSLLYIWLTGSSYVGERIEVKQAITTCSLQVCHMCFIEPSRRSYLHNLANNAMKQKWSGRCRHRSLPWGTSNPVWAYLKSHLYSHRLCAPVEHPPQCKFSWIVHW